MLEKQNGGCYTLHFSSEISILMSMGGTVRSGMTYFIFCHLFMLKENDLTSNGQLSGQYKYNLIIFLTFGIFTIFMQSVPVLMCAPYTVFGWLTS